MFVKAIGTLLLLGFFYVQLGTSLECYACRSPTECSASSIPSVICDSQQANLTTEHLHYYYRENLTSLASTNYECFFHNYTSPTNNVTYKGCVYRQIAPCSLTFKETFNSLKRVTCSKCGGNRCNPAGTFSSSMMTMIVSMCVIAVYKLLKM